MLVEKALRALLAAACAAAPAAAAAPSRLTIIHTSDIHGAVRARPDEHRGGRLAGGAAALGSLLKRQQGPLLLLDSGDWFQGTPEGDMTKGRALVDVFNALGYDAVELGNHEFDFGADNAAALSRALAMPVLAANVYLKGGKTRPDWVKPHLLKEVAGVKVGIFGLLTDAMPKLAFPRDVAGLEFRRAVDEARDQVRELKKAGATVIVAVTHVGLETPRDAVRFEGDQAIARQVPGIDVIVGGHTHIFERRPRRVNGTLIVQPGVNLAVAGKVTLELDARTGKVRRAEGELVDLDVASLGEDPKILSLLEPYERDADRVYGAVVATSAVRLTLSRNGESSLADWVTDCERQASHADLAVHNGSGSRGSIQPGPVTLRELFDVMPFENRLVTVRLTGKDVQDLLSFGVGRMAMIQASGASFKYERRTDGGESRAWDITVGGSPLEPAREYTVAASDFLTDGGGAYAPLARGKDKTVSQELLRDVLVACARGQGTIAAPAGGRMIPAGRPGGS